MIRYKSTKQITIEEFKTPFEINLKKDNRWVKLSEIIPWDELAAIYFHNLSADQGAPSVDARVVIGALIIKHKLKLSDRETIEMIQENIYMQYFLGLKGFKEDQIFAPSLFVDIRKRMGAEKFDAMNEIIIEKAMNIGKKKPNRKRKVSMHQSGDMESGNEKQQKDSVAVKPDDPTTSPSPRNKGKLILDATVAKQMIKYPTDLDLLNDSRLESERMIDELYAQLGLSKKPRTYRRKAKKQYLAIAKKRHKTKKEIRKAIGQQLRYVKRDLNTTEKMLDICQLAEQRFPLNKRDQKIYWVIQHIYQQQKYMYDNKTNSCEHRIVNIYQPHVRPIVRGKANAFVEFGSKQGVSLINGYARLNTLSWEAYNESSDLIKQVEAYEQQHGYYPEVVITDKIYGTRNNRQWLKEKGVRYSGKSLGRPPKEKQTSYQMRKQKKENGMRSQVEGKFGQGKNGYGLSKIRARLQNTSESWVACIYFVMNLVKFSKDFLFCLIYRGVFKLKNSIKTVTDSIITIY